jgi:hypothetical protein
MPARENHRDHRTEMSDLRPGDHLLGLFDSDQEQRAWVTPFILEGLQRGEKVSYLYDSHPPEVILEYLRAAGLAPEPYLASGQLSFTPAREAVCGDGCFDPDLALDALARQAEAAIEAEYTALRITAEMTWCLSNQAGCERYLEYECKSNAFLPESLCIVLCQYDRARFTPPQLLEVLAIHPWVVSAEGRHHNLYYADPEHFGAEDPCDELLHGRLRQLQSWHRTMRGHVEERERTCEMLDAIAVPVLSVDAEGCLACLNRAAEAELGVAETAKGEPAWSLLAAEEDRGTLQALLEEALGSGAAEGRVALQGREPAEWMVAMRRSGTGARVQVILTCWPAG